MQCESERPNCNWPEGTQENGFHFSDSEFTLDPEDIINLEGNERLDQPQAFDENECVSGQLTSKTLANEDYTGKFRYFRSLISTRLCRETACLC